MRFRILICVFLCLVSAGFAEEVDVPLKQIVERQWTVPRLTFWGYRRIC